MITEKAYAKINLFLDITSKKENGYHEIISLMQTIDWFDIIKIEKNVSNGIKIFDISQKTPCTSQNTAFRAAELFLRELGISDGLDITIEKNIPVSAGMAGGSADAAAVLRGCNRMFGKPFSTEDLLHLGAKIGADIPFCVLCGTKFVGGVGEKLELAKALPNCFIVCAKLGDGVSTPEAYRMLDRKYDNFNSYSWNKEMWMVLNKGLSGEDISGCYEGLYNIFESVILNLRPAVSTLKDIFSQHGGVALMSGSGPSVFGIFTNLEKAEHACQKAILLGADAKVCVPVGNVL